MHGENDMIYSAWDVLFCQKEYDRRLDCEFYEFVFMDKTVFFVVKQFDIYNNFT